MEKMRNTQPEPAEYGIRLDGNEIWEAAETTVIRVRFRRGAGTDEDLARIVTQYWTPQGVFIAECDPIEDSVEPE